MIISSGTCSNSGSCSDNSVKEFFPAELVVPTKLDNNVTQDGNIVARIVSTSSRENPVIDKNHLLLRY